YSILTRECARVASQHGMERQGEAVMHKPGAVPAFGGPKIPQQVPAAMKRMMKPLTYLAFLLASVLVMASIEAHAQGRDPNQIRTVVIDAGHGGKDPGAVGKGPYKTAEKDIVLAVALLTGKYIKEAFPD